MIFIDRIIQLRTLRRVAQLFSDGKSFYLVRTLFDTLFFSRNYLERKTKRTKTINVRCTNTLFSSRLWKLVTEAQVRHARIRGEHGRRMNALRTPLSSAYNFAVRPTVITVTRVFVGAGVERSVGEMVRSDVVDPAEEPRRANNGSENVLCAEGSPDGHFLVSSVVILPEYYITTIRLAPLRESTIDGTFHITYDRFIIFAIDVNN